MINGHLHYWCSSCSQQLELLEVEIVVVQPTTREIGNFPYDGEYVPLGEGDGDPDDRSDLPF